MISISLTDAIYEKIMDKQTKHEVWDALKQQFEATYEDQFFQVC